MNRYLADTSLLVDHVRLGGKATEFLKKEMPVISVITFAEMIQGARDADSLVKINKLCNTFLVEYVSESISKVALKLVNKYFLSNHLMLPDALIAATAINRGYILITANSKHFDYIEELSLSKWKQV